MKHNEQLKSYLKAVFMEFVKFLLMSVDLKVGQILQLLQKKDKCFGLKGAVEHFGDMFVC